MGKSVVDAKSERIKLITNVKAQTISFLVTAIISVFQTILYVDVLILLIGFLPRVPSWQAAISCKTFSFLHFHRLCSVLF